MAKLKPQKKSLKGEVERFTRWIKDVRTTSRYGHSDNYYFFISPYEPIKSSTEINEQYNIDWLMFRPSELIFDETNDEDGKKGGKGGEQITGEITIDTPIKTIANQISGLGAVRVKSLELKGILMIEHLKEANLNVLADSIKVSQKRCF